MSEGGSPWRRRASGRSQKVAKRAMRAGCPLYACMRPMGRMQGWGDVSKGPAGLALGCYCTITYSSHLVDACSVGRCKCTRERSALTRGLLDTSLQRRDV